MKLEERKIKISPAVDAAERSQKNGLHLKLCLYTKQQIPPNRITLNYKKRNVIVDGQIVVKTCEDGTLKYNHHHNIAKMSNNSWRNGWPKTRRVDCEQSR